MQRITSEIHTFILENFLFGDETRKLEYSDSFLDKGIVDSTGILELVAFVEEQFEIEVADEDLLPENFDSIDHLGAYVKRKLEPGG